MKALRSERFNMVMTAREVQMLRELSQADGISASDVVRQLIHKAYREHARTNNGARKGT